jgi:hypothetical protein
MDKTEFDWLALGAKQADPFQPFEIELEDGEILFVERREMLMYGGKAAIFFRPNDGDWEIFDHEVVRAVRIPAAARW